ncbi:putative coiled-coil domain-containing protein 195 [Meles meles]|uniref:putative coiled-coil domain-containing protein 195 n=1 Tax=Meles meles TaxID=9662 RepID=UPI001E6A0299|nr:putative coiled-coil domain-containing protein 195 [Meles meles]XP_045874523.1 putative coiled-coil domain-containing protein 195 [Meles meles]
MEANIQFIRIIQEMRAEINKLKKENQVLRMKLTSSSQRTLGPRGESEDDREEEVTDLGNLEKASEKSPATLHGDVSIDAAPAVHEHQGNVMIVRRYSISTPIHSFAANDPWKPRERHPKSGILGAQGRVKSLACSSIKKQNNEEKMFAEDSLTSTSSNQRTSPDHVCSCLSSYSAFFRDKIKTVSFQLPMDLSSYSKNSSSLKCSPNQTTNQLSTIAE